MKFKVCICCKTKKDLDSFYIGTGYADHHRNICKLCGSKKVREYARNRVKKAFYDKVKFFIHKLEKDDYSRRSIEEKHKIFIKILFENKLGLRKHTPCWDIDL